MKNESPWIMTASGRHFNYSAPKSADIILEDIATSLSNQCRFAGHCRRFYSVAEHSVLVSYMVDQEQPGAAYHALMHDCAEAYCCDLPAPLKHEMKLTTLPLPNAYQSICDRIELAIFRKFRVPNTRAIIREVKHCDTLACLLEGLTFFGEARIGQWSGYSVEAIKEARERLSLADEKTTDCLNRPLGLTACIAQVVFLSRFEKLSKEFA